jgi:hypothetical protein
MVRRATLPPMPWRSCRDQAATFADTLRSTIETRPYTTLLVAFGLGWLLGRTGRYS